MTERKNIKNIIAVTLSNVMSVMSGVFVGFLLPKILEMDGYGYYKTFTLYSTYIGLFSMGMIDGIVLKYGGKNYEELDKGVFRVYFLKYLMINIGWGLLLGLLSLIVPIKYKYICLFLGVFLIINNVVGFFQQISQITLRFKEYAARKVILAVFNILIIGGLYYVYLKEKSYIDYRIYIILWIVVNATLMMWYLYTYREMVFGVIGKAGIERVCIKDVIVMGFPLLFANLCSTLILSLDRQFVSMLFDTETYAVYAFAYNMLSLVTVATSAVSTVLFPTMKRTSQEQLTRNYTLIVGAMLIFVYGAMILYWPLNSFVSLFLPNYIDSLPIFRIIFPGLAINTVVMVVMHNYYKVNDDNIIYFKKSLLVLVLSGIMNAIAYGLFKNTISISIASIFTMIFWYLYVEYYFVKKFQYKRWKNFSYLIFMMAIFYITSDIRNTWLGLVIFICVYVTVTYLFYRSDFSKFMRILLK